MSEFDVTDGAPRADDDETRVVPHVPEAGEDVTTGAEGFEPAAATSHRARLEMTLPMVEATIPTEPEEGGTGPQPDLPPSADPADDAQGKRPRRAWLTAVLVVVVLLVTTYLVGVVAFMRIFLPSTTVNGSDVSLKSIDEIAQASADSIDTFSLAVSGEGLDLTISAADIKASVDGGAFARGAISQQRPWMWPVELSGTHELTVESRMSYDAALLSDLVGSAVDMANKDAKDPVNASIAYDEKAKRYEVKPEEAGTRLDKAAVLEVVRTALGTGEDSVELGDEVLVQPEVLSTDERLDSAVKQANSYLGATQEIVTNGTTIATIDADQLRQWVTLRDDLSVSFDEEACVKWAQGDLSKQLDTYGSKRTYTRPDGKEFTVSGGTYGWIIDGADIAARIAENVRTGNAGTVEASWKQEAATWKPGGQDWGNRYIDIDLAEQHVRFYDDGNVIWEADCVSGGLDNKGEMHATPTGVYAINSNMRSGHVKLTGKIDPKTKKPEYISYVDYWMPFVDDSVALHDADWRSSFGGQIYQSNGSHGCVNLPVGKARELYGMVGTGTVVVVHG